MQLNFNRKEYERKFLQPGGYVGKIVNVGMEGETIKVFFDIAQGEFKDVYLKEYQQAGGGTKFVPDKWNKKAVVNFNFQYTGAKYAFADLLKYLEESNQAFKWNNETNDLKGKLVGVIYKKNIYTDKFGDEKEGTDFPSFTTVKNIAEHKYSIEPVDKNKSSSSASTNPSVSNTGTSDSFNIMEDDIQF